MEVVWLEGGRKIKLDQSFSFFKQGLQKIVEISLILVSSEFKLTIATSARLKKEGLFFSRSSVPFTP